MFSNKNANRKFRRRLCNGFTLVELMVVIVIIGMLAGAVTVSTRSYLIRSKQNVAKMEIAKICQGMDTYYAEFDAYPTSEQGIEALVEKSDVFTDGLLSRMPKDPWGNPYEYIQPGSNSAYEIVCFGAGGQEGGEGAERDLSSEQLDD